MFAVRFAFKLSKIRKRFFTMDVYADTHIQGITLKLKAT